MNPIPLEEKIDSHVSVLPPDGNRLFPVFIKLEELKLLLVGAGNVGLEKLEALLGNSPQAEIQIVATRVLPELRHFAAHYPNVTIDERPFHPSDLQQKDLVIVAVDDKEVSKRIRNYCKEQKLLVNVADTPALCDFYLGSIVQKGQLKIGISTNGRSPTAAKRIKEMLNDALPEELDEMIANLHTIRNQMTGNFQQKVKQLNDITKTLVENGSRQKETNWKKVASNSLMAFAFMLIGYFIFSYIPVRALMNGTVDWYLTLDKNFPYMVLAGFLAQLVDGALGMGYGVTSATILLSAGVNLASISGSIHSAEMFASGASGYSHYKFGNVNKKMFRALVIPGVIGAVFGALLLWKFGQTDAKYLRPVMAIYTLFLGVRILINAFRKQQVSKKFKHYGWLAGAGGFLDSFGGGGWGPIVTTTLITKGRSPKYVICTVSLTEFFVTLASAFTFFLVLGVSHWQVILALIIGGLIAAPIAARLAGKLPRKVSFVLLGILVIFWSLKIILAIL
ncbi:MAG: TSUP family transporter [Chitinophagaceae bacterium]